MKQHTLQAAIHFEGQGIHTGNTVRAKVLPASENSGIQFCRVDLDPELRVRATVEHVRSDEMRQTSLVVGEGVVRTIEHLMATFHGLGVDNAIVEVDGDELPAMDGSSREFTEAFLEAGLVEQQAERQYIEVDHPVFVDRGDQSIILLPASSFSVSYTLSYRHTDLEDQFMSITVLPEIFEAELASSRTFCLKEEAQALLSRGFGKGANVANTLVFDQNAPIDNTLRYPNEACRHKILDLIGDLYLSGKFIRGHVIATRSGHALNTELVRKLTMSEKKPSESSFPSSLTIEQIQKIIPHRYPFLFVDRIEKFVPGVSAIGYKQVSMNDYFFQGHFPGHPIMPGVIIIEAMAQVGCAIMMSKAENLNKIGYFMSIDSAKFRAPVMPGDELRMEVEVIKNRARIGQCVGRAYVGDKLACEAEVKFAIVDR